MSSLRLLHFKELQEDGAHMVLRHMRRSNYLALVIPSRYLLHISFP